MRGFLGKLVKQGKLGLVDPSEEVGLSYSEKSVSNLDSARILLKAEKLEEAVSLVYYGMYNLVLALLYKVGIKSENHSASIVLLEEVFGFDNERIMEAKRERIDKQYYVGFEVSMGEVREGLVVAEDFVRELRGFISGIGKKDVEVFRVRFGEVIKS